MSWNFHEAEAPKGYYKSRMVQRNGKLKEFKDFVEEKVLIATKCGKVMESYKTPRGRWIGCSEGEPIVAWMHKPEHPHGT